MNSIGNFPKKIIISVISIAKLKTSSSLPLHMFFALFHGDFCMDLYSVDSDEALNASWLQFLSSVKCYTASLLQFLLSVKHFIVVTFYGKTSFNASLQLLLKEIHRITLHRSYFLK